MQVEKHQNTLEFNFEEVAGGDKNHALSAWTSTSRELNPEKKKRIGSLLKKLATDKHGTPFEKSYIQCLINCDQSVHIHLLKHRIGVPINGESARYKELKEDKYYLPKDWLNYECGEEYLKHLVYLTNKTNELYHDAINDFVKAGMTRQRAKESARFFKMMNSQITLDVAFNFRSFINFYFLRASEHAQLEIRELAQTLLEEVRKTGRFDLSLKAFGL
jgi:flavin-dependent thymidylate synthase